MISAILLLALPAADFRQVWNDGRAELSGYALEQPRYGELRTGRAILVFVKETFSETMRVKADPGRHPDADQFDVLKLNFVKDFQTGIYDYNLMTSAFSALDARKGRRPSSPTKIVFSGQEWCGSVFEELLFDDRKIRQKRFSYFDGEGDQTATLDWPDDGVTIDELPILIRPLGPPIVEKGSSRTVPILPSLERSRLMHRPLEWQKGTIERSEKSKTRTVPAGSFEVETWTARVGDDRYEYDVEVASPHRIIEWRGPDGEKGSLRGSERLKYWELHGEGAEKLLEKIGLPGKKTY